VSSRFYCGDAEERARGLEAAERELRAGNLVVIPTDTVYGLAADAFAAYAVDSLRVVKRRGRDLPVPVLVGNAQTLDGLVDILPPAADVLRKAFWPGGLTLIVRHASTLVWDLGDSFGTVGVRMPLHPVAVELLNRTGPLAVSSANISGQPPAATCDEAVAQLGEGVSVYLDGGPAGEPVPSTIIDCTVEPPRLLRAGALSVEELRREVPDLVT
jgi:tRNA threonylcarbamoyl adenosine modification protein (Sua5/YciO/YrdC/YwlC family)